MAVLKITRLPKDKDAQVAITINEMAKLVQGGWWNEQVRECADDAIVRAGRLDADRLHAMSNFVRAKMEFCFDPEDTELIRLPSAMAREILYRGNSWGDCDDYSIMLAAMASSYGYRSGFVTMATSPHVKDFRHVFVIIALGDEILFLDPSVEQSYDTGDLRTAFWWVKGHLPPRV